MARPPLHLYLITWNAARTAAPPAHPTSTSTSTSIPTHPFTAHIFDPLPATAPAPELIVLALQEAAPIAYAFLRGGRFEGYLEGYDGGLREAARRRFVGAEGEYRLVGWEAVGMTVMMVWAREGGGGGSGRGRGRVRWVETAGVGCGLWGMGNKGAAGVRVGWEVGGGEEEEEGGGDGGEVVELAFVSAHLAPHEWGVERRNRDWREIVEGLVFEPAEGSRAPFLPSSEGRRAASVAGDGGGYSDHDNDNDTSSSTAPLLSQHNTDTELHSHTSHPSIPGSINSSGGIYTPSSHAFVLGDLNYRTSPVRPHPITDTVLFPRASDTPQDPTHWTKLLQQDQCIAERRAGRTLHGFSEAEVGFMPSYKFRVRGGGGGGEDGAGEKWEWARTRWPSWTDRIHYLPLHGELESGQEVEEVVPRTYTLIPAIATSDHKPVAGYFTVPARPVERLASGMGREVRVGPPFRIRRDWRGRREAARRREVVVGWLAWVATTREGMGWAAVVAVVVFGGWWLVGG